MNLTEIFQGYKEAIKEALKSKKQVYCDSLVFNNKGQLLILRRNHNDDFQPGKWSLPGGKLEEGESLLIGTLRELCEETNILINPFTNKDPNCGFLKSLRNDDGSRSNYFHFNLEGEEGPLNIVLDSTEHSEWKWIYPYEIGLYNFIFDLGSRIIKLISKRREENTCSFVSSEGREVYSSELVSDFLDNLLDNNKIEDIYYLSLQERLKEEGKEKLVKLDISDGNGGTVSRFITEGELSLYETKVQKKTFQKSELERLVKMPSLETLQLVSETSKEKDIKEMATEEFIERFFGSNGKKKSN